MRPYASRTGTRRNLAGLREASWGLLVSATGAWRTEGFEDWVAENGQWTERDNPEPFNFERYERFLAWCGDQPIPPRWISLPDIVYGGLASLDLTLAWLHQLQARVQWHDQQFMIVAQDGMEPEHLGGSVGPKVGIFVGGSTEWKLGTMRHWVAFAHANDAECHVGRVNTQRRIHLCEAAGADSFDGSSASRYAVTLHPLDMARRQTDIESYLRRAA